MQYRESGSLQNKVLVNLFLNSAKPYLHMHNKSAQGSKRKPWEKNIFTFYGRNENMNILKNVRTKNNQKFHLSSCEHYTYAIRNIYIMN